MWVLSNDNKNLVNISNATVDTVVLTENSITARFIGGGTTHLYQGDNPEAVWDSLGGSIAHSLGALFVSQLVERVQQQQQNSEALYEGGHDAPAAHAYDDGDIPED